MLGHVFNYQNTPSLTKIYFQLAKNQEVSKGQFVEIKHNDGKIIGMVLDIFRYNPYYDNINLEGEDFEKFPVDDWNSTIVEVKPLGLLQNNGFIRLNNPPYPGAEVVLPDKESLKRFLGFVKNGLNLGQIPYVGLDVKLDLSRLFQKHLAILAMSGAGKSYSVSVLLEELLSRDKSLAVILFDVHGEYRNFYDPASEPYVDFSTKTKHFDASKLKIGLHTVDESLFFKLISNLSPQQYRELSNILRNLKTEKELFDLNDLKEGIENINNTNTRNALLSWFAQLESLKLFTKTSSFNVHNIVQPGKLTIIDMSNILDMTHKQIILAYFADLLFKKRRLNKIPPFLLILEEAHQFVPEGKDTKAKAIVETIAREGRKFGASLCLISQRPIKLSTTVLSQCNTHMFLRITNPYDLKHISQSSESLDSKSIEIITGLNVGEALIVGSAVNYPLFFKVRTRKSQPNKYDKNLEELIDDFIKQSNSEDLDAFL